VLAGLNNAFPMEQQSGRFFTIWYGVYRKSTRELRYASAGHPPAVLLEDVGNGTPRITELGTKGLIIGVLPDVEFECQSHTLDKRGYLYLFSDGIYEVSNSNGSTIPFPQFIDCLVEASTKKPSSLDSMLLQVRRLARRESFEDDVSIVEVVFG
jgi:sigma-B regulation protein RsbU (phosphoserine phosphatase)